MSFSFFQSLASSVTDTVTVVVLNAPNATNEVHSITVTCTIHPNSTADQCVVMTMNDGVISTGNHNNLIAPVNMYMYIYIIQLQVQKSNI